MSRFEKQICGVIQSNEIKRHAARNRKLRLAAAALPISGLLLGQASRSALGAAGLTWTGTTNTTFSTNTNWNPNTAPANSTTTNYAIFTGTPTTNQPTLTASQSIGALQFGSTAGWTLGGSANTLTLGSALTVGSTTNVGIDASALTSGTDTITAGLSVSGAETWLVGTGGTLVTSTVAPGADNVVTFGGTGNAGTLVLGGSVDNNYFILTVNNGTVQLDKTGTGGQALAGLTLNGGTVQDIGSANRGFYSGGAAAGTTTTTVNGGTFDFRGTSDTLPSLSGTGGIIDNTTATPLTVSLQGRANAAFAGTIQNSGGGALSISINNGNTQTFSGANTYTGTTTVNAGTLNITGTSSGNGAFALNGGALTINSSGTVSTSGITAMQGTLNLNGGILAVGSGGIAASSNLSPIIFNGGTLKSSAAMTIGGGIPIQIIGNATVDTTGGNITVNSSLGYNQGNAGTGTLTIQGGNTLTGGLYSGTGWTGNTVVTGTGTTFKAISAFTASGSLTVNSGATFDMANASESFGGLAGAGTILNSSPSGVSTLTITGNGGNNFSGSIAPASTPADTAVTVNLTTGSQVLSGVSSYSGGTTITGGTLVAAAKGSLGTGAVTVGAAGTLQVSAPTLTNNITLSGGTLMGGPAGNNEGSGGTTTLITNTNISPLTNGTVEHLFTTVGTSTLTIGGGATVSASGLVVGGGGAGSGGDGSSRFGGGGGGGQVVNFSGISLSSGAVVVGAGGVGSTSNGTAGGSSSVGPKIAAGGSGATNASGAGANSGGTGSGGPYGGAYGGGGGGGDSTSGASIGASGANSGGNGGNGTASSYGPYPAYGGGGGGGGFINPNGYSGLGGTGGGANGINGTAQSAAVNTGGGGGGDGQPNGGGSGGSGIVVVEYAYASQTSQVLLTGGTISLTSSTTSTLDAVGSGGSLTVADVISGGNTSANLNIASSGGAGGVVTLSGANTGYTGTTSVLANGTLTAENASALGTGNVAVAASAGLNYAAPTDAQLSIGGTLGITGGTGTTIGGTIGSTATSSEIKVTGNATASGAVNVNIYGNSFSGGTGTYTLVAGAGGSTLSSPTYTLGTVYNDTNFTVNASPFAASTATALNVGITAATPLTAAYWEGTSTAGLSKVWAASNGSTTSNWAATSGGAVQALVPGGSVNVVISGTGPAVAPTSTTLGANMAINSLTIADTTNGLGLIGDGNTLTINAGTANGNTAGNGITMNASVPASTIGANVALGASQTWTNLSGNLLTVSGNVSGAFNLTIAGGVLALSGANTYSGTTTINTGSTLQLGSANALSSSEGVVNLNGTLDLAGNSPTLTNEVFATGSLTNSSATAATLGATFGVSNTTSVGGTHGDITLSGGVYNAATINKVGSDNLFLTGGNLNSGTFNVTAGAVRVNNAGWGAAAFSASAGASNYGGGTIGGNGTVGAVTLASGAVKQGGIIAAGANSTTNGTFTTGAETWNNGSVYQWKISGNGGTYNSGTGISGTPGTNYDQLVMSGLTVPASGAAVTIDATGALTNAVLGAGAYEWAIAQIGGTSASPSSTISISGGGSYSATLAGTLLPSSVFALDTSGLTVNGSSPSPSMFSLYFETVGSGSTESNDLVLQYSATPEPGTAMLLLVGAGPLLLRRRRRGLAELVGEPKTAN